MNSYDSYKNTGVEWIGEIPSHWISRRFSYSFNIQKGKIPRELLDENLDGSLPYLSMEVLRGGEPKEFSSEKGVVIVSKGDIGLLWDGSNSGEVVNILTDGILSSTVSVLKLKDNSIDKGFSYYLLKFYENDFKNNTVGMGIPHVDGDYVKESKLLIPPLSEQLQIVSFLDNKTSLIDSVIEIIKRKIELLQEKRTSLINEVVTKGLNSDVGMKESGVEWIGNIPEHWVVSRLDFLRRLYGRLGWKSLKSEEYVEDGYVFLSTPNIKNKEIDYENVNYITKERYFESPEIILENDDVLLVKDGSTLGIVNIVKDLPRPTTVNSSIGVFKNQDNSLTSGFLYYFLSTYYSQNIINRIKGGMGVPHLFQSDIKKFKILLPTKDEQQQIVEYLENETSIIDSLIFIENNRIELLNEYRQTLISEVVTGKSKVSTND